MQGAKSIEMEQLSLSHLEYLMDRQKKMDDITYEKAMRTVGAKEKDYEIVITIYVKAEPVVREIACSLVVSTYKKEASAMAKERGGQDGLFSVNGLPPK
jgi:hypothetical protein